MHIHVSSVDGEAKFWLEPEIALAENCGLPPRIIRELQSVVEKKRDDIIQYWHDHFGVG